MSIRLYCTCIASMRHKVCDARFLAAYFLPAVFPFPLRPAFCLGHIAWLRRVARVGLVIASPGTDGADGILGLHALGIRGVDDV